MPRKALETVAAKAKVLTKSTFSGYDACINTYVGCEFGCSYCYVRFFVKDDERPWGEFVRVRAHLAEQLPKELSKGYMKIADGRQPALDDAGNVLKDEKNKPITKPKYVTLPISETRLVIGTITDPYQPKETKYRLTRTALEILTREGVPQFNKVGIFTRSPLVLQDLELIKKLPRARVHFTITPFPHEIMRAIEPYSSVTERRWDTIKKLKDAGVRVHVNVSPVMPGMSEGMIEEFAERLAKLQVDEYFVDPMQPYKESFEAFREACATVPSLNWPEIEATMLDKDKYLDWKFDYLQKWNKAREQHQHLAPNQLPIWSDHEHKVWVNLRTGEQMNKRAYGDDLTQEKLQPSEKS